MLFLRGEGGKEAVSKLYLKNLPKYSSLYLFTIFALKIFTMIHIVVSIGMYGPECCPLVFSFYEENMIVLFRIKRQIFIHRNSALALNGFFIEICQEISKCQNLTEL